MNFKSLRFQISAIIVATGLVYSFMLAFYSPSQSTKLGTDIMQKDARFISDLLAENLGLGMQTYIFDDGETLNQTLNLIRKDDSRETISNIYVYNTQLELVAKLYQSDDSKLDKIKSDGLKFTQLDNLLIAQKPMYDSDHNLLGYVTIDFSRDYLIARSHSNNLMAIIIALAFLAVIIAAGILFGNMVAGRIRSVVDVIKLLAQGEGDLTYRLKDTKKDELGELAVWFNQFISKLHDIVYKIVHNTEQMKLAAAQISDSSDRLSGGVRQQSDEISQVSAAIEEMSATINESSQNTLTATQKAEKAAEHSLAGNKLAETTSSSMDMIVQSSHRTNQNIDQLSKKANSIGDIIKVIEDIADQTNLLALNAAIEAARAGEQGRGFAVVADEVRKLAEKTAQATKEVTQTIKGIQSDVGTAREQILESESKISNGKELVTEANSFLSEIYTSVNDALKMIDSVSQASLEQSSTAEQILENIERIYGISEKTATEADQAAAIAIQLNQQSQELATLTGGFKLKS